MDRILRLVAAGCFLWTLAPETSLAQSASELYEAGVAARQEQRFDDAVAALEQALALEPRNADALVQLGFARLGTGDLAGARSAFETALAIAPDYTDASFGLAQVSVREGDREAAARIVDPLVAADPGNPEYLALQASLRAPVEDGAQATWRWRVDLGTELSDLSGGRSSWTDSSSAVTYRFDEQTTAGLRLRHAYRSSAHDVQVEARVDHRFNDRLSFYGIAAVTPDADFLARSSFGGGSNLRLFDGAGPVGPAFFSIDGRYDIFDTVDVWTVAPGLQLFTPDERFAVTGRWIHAEDDRGTIADGYSVRLDWTATDRLRAFAGYADAPEISDGQLDDTTTIFGGLSFDVSDTLTLSGSYAHEQRETFDRDTFGVGLSVRF
jgi:YaiO family outer membrane protein